MIKQYVLNIKEFKEDMLFMRFRELISEERASKIKNIYHEKDRLRSLYAEILLRYGLQKEGITKDISFRYNQNGKPELKYQKDLHFNISHSGNWIVCVISSGSVGVDVEQINNSSGMDIAKRFFTPYEYKALLDCPQEIQAESFCKLWVLKESYVKALGTGIDKSFASYGFEFKGQEVQMHTEENEEYKHRGYYFYVYPIEPGYWAAICSKEHYAGKYYVVTMDNLKTALL